MTSDMIKTTINVFLLVLSGPVLLFAICSIFTVLLSVINKIENYVKEKKTDKEWEQKILERQKRVNNYYAAERKRQNRWKIQCPALALSKEFDKIIGK